MYTLDRYTVIQSVKAFMKIENECCVGGALLPTVMGSNKVPSGLRPPSIFLNKD